MLFVFGIMGSLIGAVGTTFGRAVSVFAPSLVATKTSTFQSDVNGNGFVNRGDTLRYTVTIANGGTDATDLNFTDSIDANTTFVPGSLEVSPIAVNDVYSSIGNVGINIPSGSGLLTNDLNPHSSGTLVITASQSASIQGGTVSVNLANGSFTYEPPPGFEGSDSFTYTLSNGTGLTDDATVTINITGMIWFVNNNAAACTSLAAGCGRLSHPFSTLAAFQALNNGTGNNPATNDNIFLYESSTGYGGGVSLLSGQKLIGQDSASTLATITGLAPPAGSYVLPSMNSSNGTFTNLTGTTTLNSNVVVRGLQINSTTQTGINDAAGAIAGVNISEIANVTTTTGAAVLLSDMAGTVSLTSVSSNGAANGISLTNTSGSFTVTGDGTNTTQGGNGSGGVIQNTTDDAIRLVNVANVTLKRINLTSIGNAVGEYAIDASSFSSIVLDTLSVNGTTDHGISISGGTNFQILNSLVSNCGNAANEHAVNVANLGGSLVIDHSILESSADDLLRVTNANTNLSLSVRNNSVFRNTGDAIINGNNGMLVFPNGTSAVNVDVRNSSFNNIRGVSVQVSAATAGSNGVSSLTFENNTVSASSANKGGSVVCSSTNSTVNTYTVRNNSWNNAKGPGLVTANAIHSGTLTSIISNNQISNAVDSVGIGVFVEDSAINTTSVSLNQITNVGSDGVQAANFGNNDGSATTATLNLDASGNTIIGHNGSAGSFAFIAGVSVFGFEDNVCLNLRNNSVTGTPLPIGAFFDYYLQRDAGTFRVQGAGVANVTTSNIFATLANTGDSSPPGQTTPSAAVVGAIPFNNGGVCVPAAPATLFDNGSRSTVDLSGELDKGGSLDSWPSSRLAAFVISAFGSIPSPRLLADADEIAETTVGPMTVASAGASLVSGILSKVGSWVIPPVKASTSGPVASFSGETVTKSIGLLPAGERVTLRFHVMVDANIPTNNFSVSNQGTISGSNFASVLTDDPGVAGAANPTVTTVVQPPTITKTFTPANILLDQQSTLTITINNTNPAQAVTGITVTDTFPANVVVASPLTAATTCGAGTLQNNTGGVLAVGSPGIKLVGGTRNAAQSCTVTVKVRGTAGGTYNNTTGNVASFEGFTGTTASSTLNVSVLTASELSISGRVLTAEGRGIRNARVTISGNSLASPITVSTGVNGTYQVNGLAAGETYIVTVGARRFTFTQPSRVITLIDNVTDADFVSSTGANSVQSYPPFDLFLLE